MTDQVRPTAIVKLVNGHEVVGEIVSIDETTTTLRHPMMIQYRVNGGGFPSIALLRYSFFGVSSDVWFPNHHVVTLIQPRDSFVKFYNHTVEHTIDAMDQTIDRELNEVVSHTAQGSAKEAFYTHILENMSTETIN